VKAHKSKSPKLPVSRDVPDLASTLAPLESAEEIFNTSEVVARDCIIEDLTFDNASPESILFENCILKRVSFTRGRLLNFTLKDVRLMECDFANAEASGLKITRVEFLNCRLTGLRAVQAECQHLLISEGDASFSQFRFGVFKTSEFNACKFAEADFQSADLRGAILKGCDLTKVEMQGARLEGADFRGSRVEGLVATAEDLKGAIVDPAQAMIFAELMGLKIR
jgi:uncharacterized protein YjbI with pentapeptide repeats